MRQFKLMKQASHQGFTHIEVVPYDIIHPLHSAVADPRVQSLGLHARARTARARAVRNAVHLAGEAAA